MKNLKLPHTHTPTHREGVQYVCVCVSKARQTRMNEGFAFIKYIASVADAVGRTPSTLPSSPPPLLQLPPVRVCVCLVNYANRLA